MLLTTKRIKGTRLVATAILTAVSLLAVGILIAVNQFSGNIPNGTMVMNGIPEETLAASVREGFNYQDVFEKSMQGDTAALDQLIRFSLHTDAAAAIGHGTVLVYIVQKVGDNEFSKQHALRDERIRQKLLPVLAAGLDYAHFSPQKLLAEFAPLTYSKLSE